jgi:hypothetical protein
MTNNPFPFLIFCCLLLLFTFVIGYKLGNKEPSHLNASQTKANPNISDAYQRGAMMQVIYWSENQEFADSAQVDAAFRKDYLSN